MEQNEEVTERPLCAARSVRKRLRKMRMDARNAIVELVDRMRGHCGRSYCSMETTSVISCQMASAGPIMC